MKTPIANLSTTSNQAALLTPSSLGAIAVVRLIGPAVGEFLSRHFSKRPKAGRCVHGLLFDGSREIDDPVVVLLPGQNAADISLHGGTWVVQSLLDLAAENGFEIGTPVNEQLALESIDGDSMLEREVNAALPAARTLPGIRALLSQRQAWNHFVASAPSADDMQKVLQDHSLRWLLHPPTVAIVGAANVGKSTLANQLFGQERCITADAPGTTRDWVGEIANIDGLPAMLIDTPGVRTTDDPIENAAISQSRAHVKTADAVVLVLDATRPIAPEQSPLVKAYPGAITVINKCDRACVWEPAGVKPIRTVATSGEGIEALRVAIAAHFGCASFDPCQPRWWTQRQRQLLEEAVADNRKLQEFVTNA